MRVSTLLTTASVAVSTAFAYPGMGEQLKIIKSRQLDSGDSFELLGDLLTLSDSDLTPVGKDIKSLLQGEGTPESNEIYNTAVPALTTDACGQDTCCVWKYVADEMAAFFRGSSGRCNKWARKAVRLGFHDAGGWSKATAAQGLPGGADGSIILAGELSLPENNGLQDIGQQMQTWYAKYNTQLGYKSVTMADLIQMGATVATVVCPLGPRVKSYVGRKDSAVANPQLLPDVFATADSLIALFQDKTIGPHGLVALLGAHTTSQQFNVDTTRAGDPQDSTPGVWDVLFYGQTQGTAPTPKRVFKFASDIAISQHPATKEEWQEFAGVGGQEHWNEDFAREYIRLSLLGVNNINNLTECTKVLPPATKSYTSPDLKNLNIWLNTTGSRSALGKKIADAVNNGDNIASIQISSVGTSLL